MGALNLIELFHAPCSPSQTICSGGKKIELTTGLFGGLIIITLVESQEFPGCKKRNCITLLTITHML